MTKYWKYSLIPTSRSAFLFFSFSFVYISLIIYTRIRFVRWPVLKLFFYWVQWLDKIRHTSVGLGIALRDQCVSSSGISSACISVAELSSKRKWSETAVGLEEGISLVNWLFVFIKARGLYSLQCNQCDQG